MINEARTLLLNVSGSNRAAYNFYGEEFVDSSFISYPLTWPLQTIWNILFGNAPDRVMLNYRLRQFMTLLHSTELEEYVTDLDSRITYWPITDTSIFEESVFGATAQQLNIPVVPFSFIGSVNNLTSTSNLLSTWQITVTDSSNVTIQQFAPQLSTTISSYTLTNGLSNAIQLPNSSLQFSFGSGVNSLWQVQTLARPLFGLNDLVNQLEAPVLVNDASIFGNPLVEPYLTFSNLWYDNDELAYKLGGLLLAIIYRIKNVRGDI